MKRVDMIQDMRRRRPSQVRREWRSRTQGKACRMDSVDIPDPRQAKKARGPSRGGQGGKSSAVWEADPAHEPCNTSAPPPGV